MSNEAEMPLFSSCEISGEILQKAFKKAIKHCEILDNLDKVVYKRQKEIIKRIKRDKRVKNIEFKIDYGTCTFGHPVFEIFIKSKASRFDGERKHLAYEFKKPEYLEEVLESYKEQLIKIILKMEEK
jgi:hypothetical protein